MIGTPPPKKEEEEAAENKKYFRLTASKSLFPVPIVTNLTGKSIWMISAIFSATLINAYTDRQTDGQAACKNDDPHTRKRLP